MPRITRTIASTLGALLLVALSCHAKSLVNNPTDDSFASTVTIYRDTYGVPHVFGRTDASTVFGFAYAQAEDNFWRVEENFINALGRASELYGEKSLNEDRLNRALGIHGSRRRNTPVSTNTCVRSAMLSPPASTTISRIIPK